jgi:hypothetical protein
MMSRHANGARCRRDIGAISGDYSSAAGFATIVSPRYWPHAMQTRCGTLGAPQLGQAWTVGRFSPDFFIHAER